MRVLLAGGSGYIGSRIGLRFAQMADMELLTIGGRQSDSDGQHIDLSSDVHGLTRLVQGFSPDVVINAAGTTSADPKTSIDSHVLVTSNLLRAIVELAPKSRFIQIGSAAEYGQPVPAPQMIDENANAVPLNAYGISKLASTLLTTTQGASAGLDCIVLRVFNLIGPDMKMGTIVPRVMSFLADSATKSDDPIHLGRLDMHRDFVHIDDVVSSVIKASILPKVSRTSVIVNIASGHMVLVRDLVNDIFQAAGHRGEIVENADDGGRSAGVSWLHTNIDRANSLLGWKPTMNLSASIKDIVAKNKKTTT